MALYFVRHGESESNERNLFAGRFDTPLTALGRRQAMQAKARVEAKGLHFDEVHFTPLSRAKDTALLIVPNPNVHRVESAELVERDFGKLSEQNKSLIKKYFGAAEFESMFHSVDSEPPGGESFRAMYDRIFTYYRDVLLPLDRQGQTVLVVAHKYIVEMFALIAADLTPEQYHDFRIPNCKPLGWEELKDCVKGTSPLVNHISEEIEARLSSLLVVAAVLGVLARLVFTQALGSTLFSILVLLLLAVNSGLSLLRLDTVVFAQSLSSVRRTWKIFLLRALTGLAFLAFSRSPLMVAIGTFLLLPSAMTAPTLSLMWGGDYFLSFQTTLVMSLLSPLALGLGSLLSGGRFFAGSQLMSFAVALVSSVVVPGLVAQVFRQKRPIQAGAICTNWGWVGAAVLIPLAFLTTYQFAPSLPELRHLSVASLLFHTLVVVSLFLGLRLFGRLSAAFGSKNDSAHARANLDRYITHIAPNIFFWFTLLPASEEFNEIRLLTTLLFFVSVYIEEKRFVRAFPRQANLVVVKNRADLATGEMIGQNL